jgi:hypothetical protein
MKSITCLARHAALPAAWLLAAALLLTGCVASEISPGAELRPTQDAGYAVLSVTRTGWRDFDLRLRLHPDGSLAEHVIVLFENSSARDWTGDATREVTRPEAPEGRLVVLRLDPGTYRIDRWDGTSKRNGFSGDGYDVYSSTLDITFQVQAGQVTYLGNLNLALPDHLNYQANVMPSTYRIETRLYRERDLALLAGKYPGIEPGAVRDGPIRFEQAGAELRYYVLNYKIGSGMDRF